MTIPANDGIIAQEGLPFIGAGLIFSLGLTAASVAYTSLVVPLAILGWAFTFFCTWFFRNPERDSDAGELAVQLPRRRLGQAPQGHADQCRSFGAQN